MRLVFLTSTPLNLARGSGTFSGISTLARALVQLGVDVEMVTPSFHLPVYTLTRLAFNEQLPFRKMPACDAVIGFDMDGYRLAGCGSPPHIASIKGVIADEMRFEGGVTRWTMAVQAACERAHVRRSRLVMTTSDYAAARIRQLYGVEAASIVPEPIDLAAWRELFARNQPQWGRSPTCHGAGQVVGLPHFTVLSVCRFYPRKRLHLLLDAGVRLRDRIPELEIRIVGNGPERPRLERMRPSCAQFLGDLSQDALAAEYNRADVFCLPSVQEGFGIVFLEAMAAGKPIVAARAAAVPEVVKHGILVEPGDSAALADAIYTLRREPNLGRSLAEEARKDVEQYDAPRVARRFLDEIGKLL